MRGRMMGVVVFACFITPCVIATTSSAASRTNSADHETGFLPTTRSSLDYSGWKPIESNVPPATFSRAARHRHNVSEATEETRRSYILVYPPKAKDHVLPSDAAPGAVVADAVEHKPRQSGFRPVQKNGRQLSPPIRAYPTQVNYHRLRNAGISQQRTLMKSGTTEHPKVAEYRPPAVVYQRSPVTSKPKRRPAESPQRFPTSPQASHHQIQIQLLDGFIVPPAHGIQQYEGPGVQASGGRANHVRAVPITLNDVPEIKLLLPGDVHEQLTKLQNTNIRGLLNGERREKAQEQQQQRPELPARQNPIPPRNEADKIAHQTPDVAHGIPNNVPRQNLHKESFPDGNRGQDLGNVHQNVHFPQQEVIHRPQQYRLENGNANPQITNDHRNFYVTDIQRQKNQPTPPSLNHNRPSYPNNLDPRNLDTNPFRPIPGHSGDSRRRPEGVYSEPDPREYPQKPLNVVSFPAANQQAPGNVQKSADNYAQAPQFGNVQKNADSYAQTPQLGNSGPVGGTQQQNSGYFAPNRQQQEPQQERYTTASQQQPAGQEQGAKTQQIFQSYENVGHYSNQGQSHSQTFNRQTNQHVSSLSAGTFQQQGQNVQSENFRKETRNEQAHVEQAHVSINQQQQQVTEFFPEQQQQGTPSPPDSTPLDYSTPFQNQDQTSQKPTHYPDQTQTPGDFVQQKVEQEQSFEIPEGDRRFAPVPDSTRADSNGGYSNDQTYPTQEKVEPESGQQVENGVGGSCQCLQSCAPVYHPSTSYAGNSLREIASQLDAGALFEFINLPDSEIEALLASTGPYTLFLPSNEAISRIPQNFLDLWRQNDQDSSLALLNHVVTGRVTLDDLKLGGRMESRVPGSTLFINNYNKEAVTVNGHHIMRGDIPAPSEGIIHVVDGMICPVGDQDIIDTLRSCNKYDGFLTLADVTKLMEKLKEEGPFTVFLPSNEALTKIPTEELGVLKENATALRSFLEYHIVQGVYFSGDLKDGQYLTTLFERKPLRVGVRADGCYRRLMEANNSPLCKADIPTKNGVIHVVDWILRPSDLEWCDGVILP